MTSGPGFLEILSPGEVVPIEVEDGDYIELHVTQTNEVVQLAEPEFIEIIEQGPTGPPGPAGEGFTHTQSTPASTWIVTHNLGRPTEPTVLLDSAPTIPVLTDVVHGDLNHTTIIFPTPVTGKAYF